MQYRRCDTAEADVGMLYYLSTAEGTGGRLKAEPEDFIVGEISERPPEAENGKFAVADVTSRNWETNRLVRLMSRELGCSRERIGFAGTKDKRAVTTQLMSFECPVQDLERIDLKDVSIENAYRAKRGVRIGDLIGNSFSIRVKECDMDVGSIGSTLDSVISDVGAVGGFPNYFGVQRFGVVRPITHIVGEKIVRGDLEGAVKAYISAPSDLEGDEISEARAKLAGAEDYSGLVQEMPKNMSFEKIMVEHLISRPDDYRGAIECMPRNLQMMFVHAYQSYLFNLMLSERMARGIPLNMPVDGDVVIPVDASGTPDHDRPVTATRKNLDLVERQVRMKRSFVAVTLFGSDSEFAGGEMGEIERAVVEKEGLKKEDFIVPGLDRCSSKGSKREIVCPVQDLKYSMADGGYDVSFSLTKGNYATCLMREFMKAEMFRY
jgi:tRNA pseudouridine13 synthase